ncbi:ADP-ribosylglycohydrolase family protein [Pelagicoccus mobilis]|uniref:ADP-ribosylglycohydrolase family protein n=1 Tax=Pelagicoccus mobilis TaxID=415221 RepID=A0A934RZG3_9BACT|nr:ADP-ribosylglycohydrolase family protein [Pelagicoccus mobilis]MBK1876669.1 ADP-ribosylglycohydrolase family protein [Pelagicoccus mobilis]
MNKMMKRIEGVVLLAIVCVGSVVASPSLEDKIEGLLIGSAIGDAAGGPVEFVVPPERSVWSTRSEPVDDEAIRELGKLFKLRAYPKDVEPFAQWEAYGPEGTVTDDTRFKLIFFNALKEHGAELDQKHFAQAVMDFRSTLSPAYQEHYDTWIPEIEYATRWALGERGGKALPVERIWGGIATMEGQMPFLPIAALNPDNPEWCYRKCYELGYFDIGVAKDMNSALVAGLAAGLQSDGSWGSVERAMREVDPYRYNEVLYVRRELTHWLDVAHDLVERSEGNIARLFELLESESDTIYWWEAWVPIVVVFACAEIVDYDPMASMQLMMEFGHDTDSYAQVMGAIMGAIHGKDVFPEEMRSTVNDRMREQFDQNVDDWMELVGKHRIR